MSTTEIAIPPGTIGNFLASVLAGSGVNASGAIQGPSGLFTSGLDVSALVKVGTSILASGDINASLITARGALSVVASVAIGSAASIVGALRVSGATTLASTLEASGVLSVGGSALLASALKVSGVTLLQGGRQLGYVSISASTNITPTSTPIFLVDTAGASINIGLPSAATVSLAYLYVLKKSSDGNSLIISAATGDTIEGAAALSNTAAYTQTLLWNTGSVTWYRMLPSAGIL